MPPIVVFGANLIVALGAVLVLREAATDWRPWTRFLPALPLVSVALLIAFVLGDDSYRRNGISRWDAYPRPGGALAPMFFATVALLTLAAGSMILAVAQRRRRLLRVSALGAAATALLLAIPTVIGFSSN